MEADYLNKLAWDGAKKRYGDHLTEEQIERITFELHIMKTMGFPGYFLIVQDYIRAAREELGVSVGPGRGSAAGSVVAYCLWITDLDPLKYDLLFERFLNPDRISLPDIDVDFDDDGRSKVLTWVRKRYGEEKVAHIITYGTMATKSSVADVGRVQKVPLPTVNAIKALIPDRGFDEDAVKAVEGTLPKKMPKVNLKNCFKYIPQLRDMKNGPDENISTMLTYAQELEDTNRQVGIHACGVIIGADDLTNFAPVCTIHDKKLDKDVVVTQYDGHVVESVGLIKMDFLGLSTLTLIKEALANVKKARGIEVDISNIPIDDELTYQLYSEGRTIGTFQFESPGMQKYLRELKPTQITDLIAMNALYRPGPIEYIPTFIRRKNGLEPIEYDIPVMEKYLKDTYGVTVYQEQVMLLSRLLANFTRGEADTLRKAMGKKIFAMLAILKPKFIEGGKKNGHDPEILEKIWKDWEKFASYAFNKSHAACYAWVAYQTGYLKAHYPAEYMAANLTLSKDNITDVQKFMEECKAMKIKVKGPDVNESELNFTVNQTGEIRFGLGGVKGVGEGAVMAIVSEREKNGPYTSIFDFVERVDLKACNRKTMESLALSGAFDSLPNCTREQIMSPTDKGRTVSEVLCQYGTQCKLAAQSNVQSLFGGDVGMKPQQPILPKAEAWSDLYKLEKEKELVGIYLSAHPLDAYYVFLNYICNARMIDMESEMEFATNHLDQELMMGGVITEATSSISKRGTPCRFITVEDFSGSHKFALFRSEDIMKFSPYEKGMMVFISGRYSKRRFGDYIDFNIASVKPLADESRDFSGNLTIKIKEENVTPEFVTNFLSLIDGQNGNVNLSLSVVEPSTGTPVNVTSRTRKIKLTRPLMEYLEQMHQEGTVDLSVA